VIDFWTERKKGKNSTTTVRKPSTKSSNERINQRITNEENDDHYTNYQNRKKRLVFTSMKGFATALIIDNDLIKQTETI